MHKYYTDKILESNDANKHKQLGDLFVEAVDIIKEYSKDDYEYIENELYEIAEGKVLNEERASKIINNMKPFGMHWTLDETENVRKQYGLDNIRPIDFWIVMNSKYNDDTDTAKMLFPDDTSKQLDFYVYLSKDFIDDQDADKYKTYTYFTVIPKN